MDWRTRRKSKVKTLFDFILDFSDFLFVPSSLVRGFCARTEFERDPVNKYTFYSMMLAGEVSRLILYGMIAKEIYERF